MVTNARRLGVKRSGVRAMSVPVALAVVIMALAAPVRAGVVVGLDPTGGGGANPANTINASQLTWAPGNVLAIDVVNNGVFNTTTPVEIKYQALLGGINGTTQTGGTVAIVNQQNDTTPASGGDILLGGTSTGRELFITANFQEQIAFNAGTGTLTFSIVPGGPNTAAIYAAPAGTFKNFAGLESSPPPDATLILSGTRIASGIEGNFGGSFTQTSANATPLNQYSGDTTAQTFWTGTNTVSGTGSSFIPIKVDSVNPDYFLSAPSIVELTFPSVSTALPFDSVEPSQMVLGTPTAGTLGALNGFSGPNIMFQAQAANDFVVPEPSSIIPALTAATMIPSFLYLRWRRSRKAVD